MSGSEATSQGYTMSELDQKRNEFLIKVKQLAEEYWPEDTDSMKNLKTSSGKLICQNIIFTQNKCKKEWVDYNGHMNDAEYNRVFSDATDAWLALIGLNQETIQRLQYTIFTLENHITFLKEMKEDENIQVKVHLYDYDSKRVHVYMEMFNKDDICSAIYEVMLMGIDINTNRSAPFPEQILESIELYFNTIPINERPKQLGHRIGINRRK